MTTTVLEPPAPATAPTAAGARARARSWAPWRVARRLIRWSVLAALAISAVAVAALALLPVFGAHLLVVTSGSMEPSIATSDGVIVVDASPDDIRPGDVISYQGYTAENLTTHRVLSRHEVDGRLHFRTQGDANAAPDPDLAPAEGVVGRVVFRVPAAGRVLLALPSVRAQMLLLAGAGVLIGALQLRDLLRPAERPAPRSNPSPTTSPRRFPTLATFPAIHLSARRAALLAGMIALNATVSVMVLATGAIYTSSASITPNSFATVDVVPPTNVSAEFDCGLLSIGKGVIVSWDTVSGADGYEVDRSQTSGSGYTTIATISDGATTSYKDTNIDTQTTYYYVVRTIDGSWTSQNSTEASDTTPSSTLCLL